MKFKVNSRSVEQMLKQLGEMPNEAMKDTYNVYKKNTPIKTGNARSKTKLENRLRIGGRYPYAGNLDAGSSRQSPKGMTEPSLKSLDRFIQNYIRKVS